MLLPLRNSKDFWSSVPETGTKTKCIFVIISNITPPKEGEAVLPCEAGKGVALCQRSGLRCGHCTRVHGVHHTDILAWSGHPVSLFVFSSFLIPFVLSATVYMLVIRLHCYLLEDQAPAFMRGHCFLFPWSLPSWSSQRDIFLFFSPSVLLRYNWHTALCRFKVSSIMIWRTYIMKWLSQ